MCVLAFLGFDAGSELCEVKAEVTVGRQGGGRWRHEARSASFRRPEGLNGEERYQRFR
jgi:hypothetical protein